MTDAEAELREAIAVDRAAAGPQSLDAAGLQLRLADIVLQARGDTAQAESLMRSTLSITRATLGEHPRTSWAMSDLAELLSSRGQYREAEQLARAGLDIQRRTFGAQHPNVADVCERARRQCTSDPADSPRRSECSASLLAISDGRSARITPRMRLRSARCRKS